MNARMSFRGIMMVGLAVVALAATPAKAQDSTLLGAGAGAGGGAGIGFALGGPVGAVVGGLVGAGVGAGSGHLIGKEDKRNNARAPAAATVSGSDLTYQVQSELNAAGYNVGNPDGRNGPRTASAIRSYQANSGLVQDGQPSVPLLDHLRARRGVGPVGAAPAAAGPVAPPPPATAQPAGYTPAPALPTMPQAQPASQPAAASQPADGIDRSNCKPYETRTTIDGREMVSKGTACLQKDGSWRTIN